MLNSEHHIWSLALTNRQSRLFHYGAFCEPFPSLPLLSSVILTVESTMMRCLKNASVTPPYFEAKLGNP